jgi:Domain of unknown function (DUF3854)
MTDFNEKQLKELADSAIDSELADINISALEGDRALDTIFYALPPEERKNDGRVSDKWLNKYDHIRKHGGIAFHGVDYGGNRADCISFKPDHPLSPDRKYEQPPHSKNQAFYPAVTDRIWRMVADRFGVAMPIHPDEIFWIWVWENKIPIIITEGCKKALSAMSIGFPAIALTGIWNGVIANRDESGTTLSYDLIPSLKNLGETNIYIAFDRDEKAGTIKKVIQARSVLAKKLIEIGCQCYSMPWDSETKGLDDLIVSGGVDALNRSISNAQELTGEAPNFKKRPVANILAETIAKEWKDRIHYDTKTKCWRVYKGGIWDSITPDDMEQAVYRRVVQDAPEVASSNYIANITTFLRWILTAEK